MGITINPKPPTNGGSGEDTQLRQQFGQHKDNESHLKAGERDALVATKTHIEDKAIHLRQGDTQKIDDAVNHLNNAGAHMRAGDAIKIDNIALDKSGQFGGAYPDPDTFLDTVFITNHANAQSGGKTNQFWYIEQIFYGDNKANNARSQLARNYLDTHADIKVRYYHPSGGWSEWSPSLQDLKQSASEVKNNVAQALTDKGIPTSPSATGKQMADSIRAIPSGGSQTVSGNFTLGFGIQTLPYVSFRPNAFRAIYLPNGYDFKAQFSAVITDNGSTLVGGIEQNMQNFVIAGLLHDANGYALQLINTTSNNINMDFTYFG